MKKNAKSEGKAPKHKHELVIIAVPRKFANVLFTILGIMTGLLLVIAVSV
jgi:hypothetical protein